MTKDTKHQANILQSFKATLVQEQVGSGTVRSYLSDARHFLAWFSDDCHSVPGHGIPALPAGRYIDSHFRGNDINSLTRKTVVRYYEYLFESQTPRPTLNRRLSSLRKFGAFCVSQGWLTDNYFSYLKNITVNQAVPQDGYHLTAYRNQLIADGNSPNTIKSYLSDVKHFINWHACHSREGGNL